MAFFKTRLGSAAIAVMLVTAAASTADAWTRSGSGVGPRGNSWSSTGAGSCAGGSCSSRQTFTGPRGGITTRTGSTSCAGGTCNHMGTVTGPNGGGFTRNSTFSR